MSAAFKTGALMQWKGAVGQFYERHRQPLGSVINNGPSGMFSVDLRRLVSDADLYYSEPVTRSEEGMPIGNGHMGSLIWTEPSTLKFQINRNDVFAENCQTNSFPERDKDYGSGCAYLDVDFGDVGPDIFIGEAFRQHLSVYDGVLTTSGSGVSARVIAHPKHDVLAMEVRDTRPGSEGAKIDLRMLRYEIKYLAAQNFELAKNHSVKVVNRNQSATSILQIRGGRIALIQVFQEGSFYNASAVVVQIVGRRSKARYANDSIVRLDTSPGKGKWTILIASAASFQSEEDVVAKAIAHLDAVQEQTFFQMTTTGQIWWHDFWSKSFVRISGPDGSAAEVQRNYIYYLYVMGACSRGTYMPHFGGMLWLTNGDMRQWGAQHWWHNESCYYNPLFPANRPDILEPMFATYSGMRESCALAAKQQWGSQGVYLPETTWFDGLETLPEDIAAEMRELYLMRKPWDKRSERFRYYAEPKIPHNSRWNWKGKGKWVNGHFVWRDRGIGPFGPVSHIFSSGAKIAYLYWIHYEHIQDRKFLEEQAYPMLKGVAEFYRNFPNLSLGQDGKYHIHYVNNHEPVLGAQDTQEEISAMMGIFPMAVRAAEILGTDADLQERWRDVHAKLTPLPTNATPGATVTRRPGEPERWISGLPPVLSGNLGAPRVIPALFFDLCCVETTDQQMWQLGQATFQALYPKGIDASIVVTELSADSTAAAHLGRGEDMQFLLLSQIRNSDPARGFCDFAGSGAPAILPNRMTLREGPGAIGVERLGRMSEALHAALLQSNPPEPGGQPILHVFPAWPKTWEAQFTLSARGGYLVSSSITNGGVEFVEINSRAGQPCHLRNPWSGNPVVLFRNGEVAETLHDDLLHFSTAVDESVVVCPEGRSPKDLMRHV